MAEHNIGSLSRPTPSTNTTDASRKERRKPNIKLPKVEEATNRPQVDINARQGSRPAIAGTPHEAAPKAPRADNARPGTVPLSSAAAVEAKGSRSQTFFHPRVPSYDGPRSEEKIAALNIRLHDIIQSRWIVDPDNNALEQVHLTIEDAPVQEMATIDTSFCWVHHERDPHAMQFDDFIRILNSSPGMYKHEHEVPLKCLDEVKHLRRVFAKGRYFDPCVHETKQTVEIDGQKTQVKATFMSMPIFSSMRSAESSTPHEDHLSRFIRPLHTLYKKTWELVHEEDYSKTQHHHLASKVLNERNGHPTRSLMEHRNILAVDHSRDFQQAVIKLEDDNPRTRPFIHVPEFWALIVNMYTIITCAPFSVEELQGEHNIIFRQPPVKDQRIIVKYTNLNGALHDFRCKTWLGHLNIISRIETQIDEQQELGVLLLQEQSEYQLIDAKFRRIDRKRWIALTQSQTSSRSMSVRLFWTDRGFAWEIVKLEYEVKRLQQELDAARKQHFSFRNIMKLETILKEKREAVEISRHRRALSKFLLCAVRYHLIDPKGMSWADDERWQQERRLAEGATTVAPRTSRSSPAITSSKQRPTTQASSGKMVLPPAGPREHFSNDRDTALAQNALDHFQSKSLERTPLRNGLTNKQAFELTPELISDHFRGPKRAMTSQSLRRLDEAKPPPLHKNARAKTLYNKEWDIEAQIPQRKPKQLRASVGPQDPTMLRAPTYVISASSNGRLHHSTTSLAGPKPKAAHIFRTRPPTDQRLLSGSLNLSPRRLPLYVWQKEFPKREVVQDRRQETRAVIGLKITTEVNEVREVSTPLARRPSEDRNTTSANAVRERVKSSRRQKNMKQLLPFFEWRSTLTGVPATPIESTGNINAGTESNHVPQAVDGLLSPSWDADRAAELLEILDDGLSKPYHVREGFPVRPVHYSSISQSRIWAVADELHIQSHSLQKSRREAAGSDEDSHNFLATKIDIMLRVDGIICCFVNDSHQDEPLVAKAWGIVLQLSQLKLEDLKATVPSHFKHAGGKLLVWAVYELSKIERLCREMLVSARSETGEQSEQLDLPLPYPFKTLFRDILLFLLTVLMAAKDPEKFADATQIIRDKVVEDMTDAETALMRTARSFKDNMEEEDQFLNESIKTADTILGLLLQNAFALSCSDLTTLQHTTNVEDHPHCDLEHIYRRWTAVCHDRAIKEASAEMYEEVRLLQEEIGVIIRIFEDQQQVYSKALQLRESPKQNLDIRINKRIETHLQDMIKHFTTLEYFAKEAETLTTNSIRVRNEDNSKAIYIFTTVTVLFLPLSAVSSIFGMNTKDFRKMGSSSWLYWVIAVPVTFAVLVACLILVRMRFRFKLRRHFGRALLKCFPKDWGRDHVAAKELARGMPRQ